MLKCDQCNRYQRKGHDSKTCDYCGHHKVFDTKQADRYLPSKTWIQYYC